jgi:hypothetical protein
VRRWREQPNPGGSRFRKHQSPVTPTGPVLGGQEQHNASATYAISGRTRTESGAGIVGVTLSFSNGAGTAISDANGNYTKSGLSNGTYTITPSKAGYLFSPSSKTITLSGANQTGINFIGSNFVIYGYVRKTDATGINGVTVTFKQGNSTIGTATTDATGWYQRSGFFHGTYTVIPSKVSWGFTDQPPLIVPTPARHFELLGPHPYSVPTTVLVFQLFKLL